MKVHCLYDKLVNPVYLKPHPKNRNRHPAEQIERLAAIIKYQGWRHAITISNRSGFITKGHGRLEAAVLKGWDQVPVVHQDYDSDEMEYSDAVADNAIASWAELDMAGINADIGDLGPDFDIGMLGIKGFTVDVADKGGLTDPDEVPEPPKVAKTKLGDIYQLGPHRLMCGDSTALEQVQNLMSGKQADMVFTDPPYGMFLDTDYSSMASKFKGSSGGNKYDRVRGDHSDFSPNLINTVFASFPDCPEIFLWGADYYADILPRRNSGSWIVWDKRGDESADKMFGSGFELCWSKARHKRDLARVKWAGIFGMEKEHDKKRVHPTQKPVQLVEWFFERWGKPDDKVVDLFGGSGSTLIACEKTNRKCFMMELDPIYCDVIIARWEQFTGQKAKLVTPKVRKRK